MPCGVMRTCHSAAGNLELCGLALAPQGRAHTPPNRPKKNLRRSTEVKLAATRIGVGTLAQEALVLHLLPDNSAGNVDVLTSNNRLKPMKRHY